MCADRAQEGCRRAAGRGKNFSRPVRERVKGVMARKNYIFTNKKHSPKSIMSTVLGVIATASLLLAAYLSYAIKGAENMRYGTACFLAMLFAFVGLTLGVLGRMEKDRFYFFSYVGILLNVTAIGLVSLILYAGALL